MFGFDLVHDKQTVISPFITIQSALLYTCSEGERRIRVCTQALPVTALTSEVASSVNSEALSCLLSKQALKLSVKTNLDNARNRLIQICGDICRAAKAGDRRSVSGYTVPGTSNGNDGDGADKPLPENLKLLPLYTLAMLKNVAFRGGTDVHPDERITSHMKLNSLFVEDCKHFLYPRMFGIHDMPSIAGMPLTDDNEESKTAGRNRIVLPSVLNLSADRLSSEGIFLVDNGVEFNIWVGSAADPSLVQALFGTSSFEDVDVGKIFLKTSGNDQASRLDAIIQALREEETGLHSLAPRVIIIKDGDAASESRFFWNFVEDRDNFNGGTYSYADFMEYINRPPTAPGVGPGGPNPGRAPMPPPGGMPPAPGGYQRAPPNQAPGPPGMAGPPRGGPPPPGPPMRAGPPPPGPPRSFGSLPPAPMGSNRPMQPSSQLQMSGPPSAPPRFGGPPPPGPSSGYRVPQQSPAPPKGPPAPTPPPPMSGGFRAPPPGGQQRYAGQQQYGAPQQPPPGTPGGGMPPPPPPPGRRY